MLVSVDLTRFTFIIIIIIISHSRFILDSTYLGMHSLRICSCGTCEIAGNKPAKLKNVKIIECAVHYPISHAKNNGRVLAENVAALLDISTVTWPGLSRQAPNWKTFNSEHEWSLDILRLEQLVSELFRYLLFWRPIWKMAHIATRPPMANSHHTNC